MKKSIKILLICLAALILIAGIVAILLINNKSYTDKYGTDELYNKVENSFVTDGGTIALDDDVILEFTEDELSYLKDYTVIKAKNAKNINEIGIFKVDSGSSKKMKALVEAYVENLQKAYRAMDYFPEEVEKIDCATVKVYGNYVIYSFLSENDTESFYNAIENVISE